MILSAMFVSTFAFSQTACYRCGGYGKFSCNTCGGAGVVYQQVYNPYYGMYQPVPYTCVSCSGYGAFSCTACGGSGYVYSSSSTTFRGTNSDGFVQDGRVTLERDYSGKRERFVHYKNIKNGLSYVKIGNDYIKVSGKGTVTINNIKYVRLGGK